VTPDGARRFVERHGVVLEAGRGPVPSLAEAVAGEPIRGSWWSHPKGRQIFALTRNIRDRHDVLVCRAVGGKVTYVHRRLWPALVRLAQRFDSPRLAAFREVHTSSGQHALRAVPYPRWVPSTVRAASRKLSDADAARMLGDWIPKLSAARKRPVQNR